jgi:ESCRT-II complex subunit VPS22
MSDVLLCFQEKGFISEQELQQKAGWAHDRARECLGVLLKEGMTMIDDGAPDGVRLFWFPAVSAGSPAGGVGGTSVTMQS